MASTRVTPAKTRVGVVLTNQQLERLRTLAEKRSLGLSEYLRRILDQFLADQDQWEKP